MSYIFDLVYTDAVDEYERSDWWRANTLSYYRDAVGVITV